VTHNPTINPDGSHEPAALAGHHDTLISSAGELETLDARVSGGDVALIEQPATPYRTSSWIDLNTSGVRLIAQSPFAENGEPVVSVADSANVGGLRVGETSALDNIRIERFGFYGNAANQSSSAKNLFGIKVQQTDNVKIRGCYVENTSPQDEHGGGGSSISVGDSCNDVWIQNNRIHDAGDRGIEASGNNVVVTGNRTSAGYDRGVSISSDIGVGQRAVVTNNIISGCADGSAIGYNGAGATEDNVIVSNNILYNNGNAAIKIFSSADRVVIDGNVGHGNGFGGVGIQQSGTSGEVNDITISNNVLECGEAQGVKFLAPTNNFSVVGNQFYNMGAALRFGPSYTHSGGTVGGNLFSNYGNGAGGTGVKGEVPNTVFAFNIFADGKTQAVRMGTFISNNMYIGNYFYNCATLSNRNIVLDVKDGGSTWIGNVIDGQNVSGASIYDRAAPSPTTWHNNQFINGGGYINQDQTIINSEVIESASAETPQGSYPTGTLVRFTDSGDGSGTGTYLVTRDGGTIQISSSA